MNNTRRLNRRSFFTRVMGAALGAGGVAGSAHAITDSDPTDRAYQGSGCVADSDPSDRARCGSGQGGGSSRSIGYLLLIAGAGAAAAGTYLRRKRD